MYVLLDTDSVLRKSPYHPICDGIRKPVREQHEPVELKFADLVIYGDYGAEIENFYAVFERFVSYMLSCIRNYGTEKDMRKRHVVANFKPG